MFFHCAEPRYPTSCDCPYDLSTSLWCHHEQLNHESRKITVYWKICYFYLGLPSQTLRIFKELQGKWWNHFYSFPSLLHAYKHSVIYLQFYILTDYPILLIAAHVAIRLLLDDIHPPLRIGIQSLTGKFGI